MARKKYMKFNIYENSKKLKSLKCDVTGAEYNRLQKARNCISRAVSKMGCEELGTNFKKKRVKVNCAYRRLKW